MLLKEPPAVYCGVHALWVLCPWMGPVLQERRDAVSAAILDGTVKAGFLFLVAPRGFVGGAGCVRMMVSCRVNRDIAHPTTRGITWRVQIILRQS